MRADGENFEGIPEPDGTGWSLSLKLGKQEGIRETGGDRNQLINYRTHLALYKHGLLIHHHKPSVVISKPVMDGERCTED